MSILGGLRRRRKLHSVFLGDRVFGNADGGES